MGVTIVKAQILGLGFGQEGLEAETTAGTLAAPAVILATGTQRRRPRIPGLDELDGAGVSYCAVCDGFFCRGKEVAVLGAGPYALHEAGVLLPLARRVTLLTNGEPADGLPQGLELDSRPVAALEGDGGALSAIRFSDGSAMEVSRLFVALGTAGSGDLARKVGLLTEHGTIVVDGAWPPMCRGFLQPETVPGACPKWPQRWPRGPKRACRQCGMWSARRDRAVQRTSCLAPLADYEVSQQ